MGYFSTPLFRRSFSGDDSLTWHSRQAHAYVNVTTLSFVRD
jgi:hypothetical protein